MKRITALLLSICIFLSLTVNAFAADVNIDGGGGGMGDGDRESYWNPGNDGVRVTIVRESDKRQMTTPMDFTNTDRGDPLYFGFRSKLEYRRGTRLTPTSGYEALTPASPMPRVISSGGASNIAAVKQYFGQEGTLRDICDQTGFDFEDLLTKKYIVLLEPIAYFKYDGDQYAMTATEAAMFDNKVGGHLCATMGNLTHQNLPLAMFLEISDLGFPAYTGGTSGLKSNSTIISSLGLGTVRFEPLACCDHTPDCPCILPEGGCDCEPDIPCDEDPECQCVRRPAAEVYDYTYRTNTDVITSIMYDPDCEVSPDDDCEVTFEILDDSYDVDFVCPRSRGQLVWVKWHTPDEPQVIEIPVTSSLGDDLGTITCNIVNLEENTPPHTTYYDEKPSDRWQVPRQPDIDITERLEWGYWDAYWEDCDCDECDDDCEGGEWEYDWMECSAWLTVDSCEVFPDERVPTAKQTNRTDFEMKSGYGVDVIIETSASLGRNGRFSQDMTDPQNVVAYFPEFGYETHNRVLEQTDDGKFEFKVNRYSYYDKRVHFTPIWYPDREDYTPYFHVIDCWTPAGELTAIGSDSVEINGAMWDDYTWGSVR